MKFPAFHISAAIILGLSAGTSAAETRTIPVGVSVDHASLQRHGDYMNVDLSLDFSKLRVESNRAVLLTPSIINGSDTLKLPAVGIYGRVRYYQYQRNSPGMISGADETVIRASELPDSLHYSQIIPYADWMNGSSVYLDRSDFGCCRKLLAEAPFEGPYGYFGYFTPKWVYVRPQGNGEKHRELSGSAFIDFPVDQTVIYPEYRRNTTELAKIQATIDSVRGDGDVTITRVWLKGFASPESPYSHNRDLAIGRTAALKDYIQKLYRFDSGIIATDFEPEDWAGLKKAVDGSNLPNRTEILALIDSDMEPDAKEARIKKLYPEDYRFMLQTYYPALRHTDYRIEYNIRTYSDVNEIRHIMKEQPQKLSLNEFYLLAQDCQPGSEEFNDVFETAVRMYPSDPAANLNAAVCALERGDLDHAARFLDKAGTSEEAEYIRGVREALKGNYSAARAYFEKSSSIPEAADAIRQLDKLNAR